MELILTPTFLQAFGIILREGLEALLILGILAAYVRKVGQPQHVKSLYAGAGLAVAASFGIAWAFAAFNNGAHDDRIEAITLTAAAVLLFYVSGWLFVRQNPASLKAALQRRAGAALQRGTLTAMGTIAFFAVLREGAETVLFLHGLTVTTPGALFDVLTGLAAATIALAFLFMAIQKAAFRIPLKPLFIATSAFLFATGLHFVALALQELQELTLIAYTPIGSGNWSWEVATTLGLICLAAGAGALLHLKTRRQAGASAA